LNIEFLPTFRDDTGPFGSPTSDSVRTMVTPQTQKFLMPIFNFGQHINLEEVMQNAIVLLEKYANATSVETQIIV